MGAPAKFTTASTSASTAGSMRRWWGSQRCSSTVRGVRRTSWITSCPSALSAGSSALPISPEAPVTAIFIVLLLDVPRETESGPRRSAGTPIPEWLGEPELALELTGLEPFAHRGEEAGGVGAVNDAVVVGQRQVDHRADRDDLAEVGVLDDDRPLHHRADTEDRHLRLVDDRGVEQRAPAAGVGQREGAAPQLVRRDLVRAGALGQIRDLPGDAAD